MADQKDQNQTQQNSDNAAGNSATNDDDQTTNDGSANDDNNTSSTGSVANDGTTTGSSPNDDAEYQQLKLELEETQSKLQDMVSISQRALADLQNFRRRAEEEKTNFVQYANADLILALLPTIDNAHRALTHEPKDAEWSKGVEQILRQLTQIIEKKNVKTIATVGQKFDPTMHEALLMGPGEKDLVTEELEKGYLLGDRVLKRARVKVGDGTATA
ncbi:MAG: nucleotide exchange factor GrpE [Candidatus Gracilibacteria bacterium]|jgi:molecular chaperone GrpE